MARTVADLGSWVVALVVSFMLAPKITELINLPAYPWVGLILAFVLLFFVTRLLGVIFSKALRSIGLAGADRSLGACWG